MLIYVIGNLVGPYGECYQERMHPWNNHSGNIEDVQNDLGISINHVSTCSTSASLQVMRQRVHVLAVKKANPPEIFWGCAIMTHPPQPSGRRPFS